MTKNFRVRVTGTPKSVNRGGGGYKTNQYVAAREKKFWGNVFAWELLVARVPKDMLHCAVEIELHFSRRNHRDEENFRHPVIKPLADALVQNGWLPDDTKAEFEVKRFELVEGEKPWPSKLFSSYMIIDLEATYP